MLERMIRFASQSQPRPGRITRCSCIIAVFIAGGCGVHRTITVNSEPPAALVYMNDQEVGRTPFTRDFTWYGWYDVQVRLDGYETLQTRTRLIAPWWQWPPIDLLAEICPFRPMDHRTITYTLRPASTQPADPQVLLARAQAMRAQLQSSRHTHQPTTLPSGRSAAPSTTPATLEP